MRAQRLAEKNEIIPYYVISPASLPRPRTRLYYSSPLPLSASVSLWLYTHIQPGCTLIGLDVGCFHPCTGPSPTLPHSLLFSLTRRRRLPPRGFAVFSLFLYPPTPFSLYRLPTWMYFSYTHGSSSAPFTYTHTLFQKVVREGL